LKLWPWLAAVKESENLENPSNGLPGDNETRALTLPSNKRGVARIQWKAPGHLTSRLNSRLAKNPDAML
jgi:hypothetical protein